MQIRLKKRARVWRDAGEIIEVSPVEGAYLLQVGIAEAVSQKKSVEKPNPPKRETRSKK